MFIFKDLCQVYQCEKNECITSLNKVSSQLRCPESSTLCLQTARLHLTGSEPYNCVLQTKYFQVCFQIVQAKNRSSSQVYRQPYLTDQYKCLNICLLFNSNSNTKYSLMHILPISCIFLMLAFWPLSKNISNSIRFYNHCFYQMVMHQNPNSHEF